MVEENQLLSEEQTPRIPKLNSFSKNSFRSDDGKLSSRSIEIKRVFKILK